MLHKKQIYFIVVPDICCSKNPTTCTCFFWSAVRLDPCHHPTRYPSLQCHNGISSMVGYHDHVSTASSQRDCVSPSTLSHYNLANMCGWRSSSHSSLFSETRHVSGNSWLKNIPSKFMSDIYHVLILLCFFCPLQQRSETQRGCLLKQDMSADDNCNCYSGRLSRGNLQGHTPWVSLWVPWASSRLTVTA